MNLKPCPCCGSNNIKSDWDPDNCTIDTWIITCRRCNLNIWYRGIGSGREKCALLWNKRVSCETINESKEPKHDYVKELQKMLLPFKVHIRINKITQEVSMSCVLRDKHDFVSKILDFYVINDEKPIYIKEEWLSLEDKEKEQKVAEEALIRLKKYYGIED